MAQVVSIPNFCVIHNAYDSEEVFQRFTYQVVSALMPRGVLYRHETLGPTAHVVSIFHNKYNFELRFHFSTSDRFAAIADEYIAVNNSIFAPKLPPTTVAEHMMRYADSAFAMMQIRVDVADFVGSLEEREDT